MFFSRLANGADIMTLLKLHSESVSQMYSVKKVFGGCFCTKPQAPGNRFGIRK